MFFIFHNQQHNHPNFCSRLKQLNQNQHQKVYLVTFEKKRFPSGSTVKRDELIVFRAPLVLWGSVEVSIVTRALLELSSFHLNVKVFIATMDVDVYLCWGIGIITALIVIIIIIVSIIKQITRTGCAVCKLCTVWTVLCCAVLCKLCIHIKMLWQAKKGVCPIHPPWSIILFISKQIKSWFIKQIKMFDLCRCNL